MFSLRELQARFTARKRKQDRQRNRKRRKGFLPRFEALEKRELLAGDLLTNLALDGTADQSSTGWGGAAERAIDGNTSSLWRSGTITHTQHEQGAWWQVELQQQSEIEEIKLWNRSDRRYERRLSNFRVSVFDGENEVFGQDYFGTGHVHQTAGFAIDLPDGVVGDRVKVQLNGRGYLSLAEVQVFGQAATTTADTTDSEVATAKLTAAANVSAESAGTTQTFTNSDTVAISSSGTPKITSDIVVSGMSGAIADVDLALDIRHTWDADLDVFLIAPDGTRLNLFTDVGGRRDNFYGTVLDDEAPTAIQSGSAPFTGRFRPENDALSLLDGKDPNGTWTLEIRDDANNDGGALNRWSITLTTDGTPGNSAPVAVDDVLATDEDVAAVVDVLGNDSDGDGDLLTIVSASASNGSVTINADGTLSYTPNENFNGADTIDYSISDGNGGTAAAQVAVSVAAVNDAPVAVNDGSKVVAQGKTVTIDVLSNDSDVDGDSLTVTAASAAHGSVVINADGTLSYTPSAGFLGSDAIAYTISDGGGGTDSAAMDITVVEAIEPKLYSGVLGAVSSHEWMTVTLPQSYHSMVVVATPVYEGFKPPVVTRIQNVTGNSFDIKVQRADNSTEPVSGLEVQFVVVEEGQFTAAEHGVTMEAVKYNSTVTDNKASWGGERRDYLNSYTSPVVIGQVMSANDDGFSTFWTRGELRSSRPDASNLYVGKMVGEDPDTTRADETVGYIVIEAGTGTLGDLRYSAGVGADSVQGVVDGRYYYNIPGITDATSAVLSVAGMDGADGGWAMLIGTTGALNGSTITLGIGEDALGDSERNHTTEDVAYLVFEAANPNAIPVAHDDGPLVVNHNQSLNNINVLANDTDADGDTLTVTAASASHGAVAINADSTLNYTPDSGYSGADSITYSISDGNGGTDTAAVSITVNAQNNVPVATDDDVVTDEDNAVVVSVLDNDTDADGDTLNLQSFAQGAHGSVRLSGNGTLTYTPDRNYNGSDSFTYTINDGNGATASATVTVDVTAVNDAPSASNDSLATPMGVAEEVNVLANDSDVEGDAISVVSFTDGANGTVTDNGDGTLTYTPNEGFMGSDSFTYVVSDEHGAATAATVNVTVYHEGGGQHEPGMHGVADILALVPVAEAGFVSNGSGNWSDPATWAGGVVPGDDGQVVIAAGHTVTIDSVQTVATKWIRVDGTLNFDHTVNTRLYVETLAVAPHGTLQVGTAANPIGANGSGVTAEILIADAGADFDNSLDVHELGRGIVATGRVEMHGDVVTPYVSLAVEPLAGATELVIDAAPQGWQVGDRLVITGSGQFQDETLVITGISQNAAGQTVVSIDNDVAAAGIQGLAYNHTTPGYGIKIFVANMQRHIQVRSENPDILNRRGHVMFMHNQNAEVAGAGFYGLGRTDKTVAPSDPFLNADGELVAGTNPRGRYAVHFHEAGTSTGATPGVVTGSVVEGSPGWGYVNHSSYANISNNVAYDVLGASFVAERGDEQGTFTGNLSIRNTGSGRVTNQASQIDTGHAGYGFFLEGTGVSVIDNIVTGPRHAGFGFHKTNTFASEFSGNMVYGTSTAITMYKQLGQIVFEGLTTWTSDSAILFPYARHITVRNSTLIGNPASPRGKAIDALVEQFYTEFDNNTIVGWETGLMPQGTGTVIIRDGYYANVKNIVILPGGGFPRQYEILGNPQFETLTASQLNGREQVDYDLWPGVGGGDLDIESNFEPGQTLVLFNDQQIYWAEQASDHVPYPAGYPTPSWIPVELLNKTNQQIVDEFGLVPGGAIAPPDAVAIPRSNGLLGARAEYLPAITLLSNEYSNNLDAYTLSYRTPDGTVVTESDPIQIREGWNVLTRQIDGSPRSLLVYGDITAPTIWVGPTHPSVHYDSLSSGVKIKTLLSDNTFGPRRLTLRYGDLSGHQLEVDHAGQPYILVSASATDFAGNRTTREIRVNVLGAPITGWVSVNRTEFLEDLYVPGKILNQIILTARGGEKFTADAASHVSVTNLPAGLTARFNRIDDTIMTLTLEGTASAHAAADSINNFGVTFTDAAFTGGNASTVFYATRDNLSIVYEDSGPAWLDYNTTWFWESAANDGTIATEVIITLTGDFFTEDAANHITVQNVPAGLTPHFERLSATQMKFTLIGNATAHAGNDTRSDLHVQFLNGAFVGGNAWVIDDSIRHHLALIFED